MRYLLLALLALLNACFWKGVQAPERDLQSAVEAMVAQVAPAEAGLLLAGLRDQSGKRSALTRLLDEEVAGALVRLGAQFELDQGEEEWRPAGPVPVRYLGAAWPPVLIAGQVLQDSAATYLRLQALDRAGARVLKSQTLRLEGRALDRRLSAAAKEGEQALGVQLHLLVLRAEGGFDQQLELVEGGKLRAGDRLQLRFRAGVDCHVYAWLYSSAGQQQDLFASQQVYKGALHETSWLKLDQANQVHTLYLIAAPRLDEDQSQLFEALAELMSQGQISNFTGIERIDQVVGQYLARYTPDQAAVPVPHLAPPAGAEEKFILGEGTVLKSRPLLLGGEGVLVQALSFEVQ